MNKNWREYGQELVASAVTPPPMPAPPPPPTTIEADEMRDWYKTDDGTTVITNKYINKAFITTRECNACGRNLWEHEWVEFDGMLIVSCSFTDTQKLPSQNFTEYVVYNEFGGINKRLQRADLEVMMHEFFHQGILGRGCWEFERDDDEIHVRLAPQYEIDGANNNWRSWNYTFVPYVP